MSNEFISRLDAIGLRKETNAGTESALDLFWIPKITGGLKPVTEKAELAAGFGVIDNVSGSAVETRSSLLDFEGILSDTNIGAILLAAFGSVVLCKCLTITGAAGGSPAKGNTISSATGAWSGTIQKVITVGATTYYFVSTTTGTIGANVDVTNGTWTGGTTALVTGVNGHYFTRLNTNNHPSFTMYEYTPVSQHKALYGMNETFDVEFARGDFAKVKGQMKGKPDLVTTGLSPAFATENYFLNKHFGVKFGANEAALNAATLVVVEKMAMTIAKNLNLAYGSRDAAAAQDVRAIFNQAFAITGSIDFIYNADTYRDYVTSDTVKAVRQEWINYQATALSGAIYPSLYIDYDRVSFRSWDRTDDNDALTGETIAIVPEYDRTAGRRVDALLINGRTTAY